MVIKTGCLITCVCPDIIIILNRFFIVHHLIRDWSAYGYVQSVACMHARMHTHTVTHTHTNTHTQWLGRVFLLCFLRSGQTK